MSAKKRKPAETSAASRDRGRRDFLKMATTPLVAWCATPMLEARESGRLPNPVGYATISWPRDQFEHALRTISQLGFQGTQMLGWVEEAYAGSKEEELLNLVHQLKLEPVALSASEVRVDPANPVDQSARLRQYAVFQQKMGGKYLQVTDAGKPDGKYSDDQFHALGARMNDLGRVAEEYGLGLGYHPHFGTYGETRKGLGRVLAATDPDRVKLIADVAHLTLGGSDPAEVIRTYQERMIFLHFKDVPRNIAQLARRDPNLVRRERYHFCEIGQGVVNFPAIMSALRDVGFTGWIVVELDGYRVPRGGPDESARTNCKAVRKLGLQVHQVPA
ncbi:MAG: sugar phosphate isomerase/epimerase family protein [Terriglobia bacterium]